MNNFLEFIQKDIEVKKKELSLMPVKSKKSKKVYNDTLKKYSETYKNYKEDVLKYMKVKLKKMTSKSIQNKEEIDRIEKEKTTLLDALEEQFSEINIAKLVQSALTSGFVELNGEVKSLQDLLIENINNTIDAYSVMGATIKQEMVDNLSIALDTMKELEGIYKGLNINDFGLIYSNMSSLLPSNNYNANTRSITVGETNITINGSISNDILNDIEDLIEQKNNKMLKSITKNL